MSADEALAYVKGLGESKEWEKERAWQKTMDYVCSAPAQIATEIRRRFYTEFVWSDRVLSSVLFEP